MVTRMGREQRTAIWDYLRHTLKIDAKKMTSNDKLYKEVRRKFGLKKYQRAPKEQKGLLKLIRKGSFWKQSKQDDRYFMPKQRSEWTRHEESLLKELSRDYSGKELVKRYNEFPGSRTKRSYSSVTVKIHRLKKSK